MEETEVKSETHELPVIQIKHTHRYFDKYEKHLAHQFCKRTHNVYEGLFVVNDEMKFLTSENEYLIKKDENAWLRTQELIDYKPVIVDSHLLKNTGFVDKLPNFGKCYIYCVDNTIHNEKVQSILVSDERYPGVRFFKDYHSMILYLESRYYRELITIIGIEALSNLKYLVNKIELFVLDEVKEEMSLEFPINDLATFMNFNVLSNTKTYSVKTSPPELQEVKEREEKKFFSEHIRFSDTNLTRKLRKKLRDKSLTSNYEIVTLSRKHCSRVKRLRKSFAKHLGLLDENMAGTLRLICLNDYEDSNIAEYAVIYDCNAFKDLAIRIVNLKELQVTDIHDICMWSNEQPHSVAITETQIESFIKEDKQIDIPNFINLCISNSIQIQNR